MIKSLVPSELKDVPLRPPIPVSNVSDAVSFIVVISNAVLRECSLITPDPRLINNFVPSLLNSPPLPTAENVPETFTPVTPPESELDVFIVEISYAVPKEY